MQELLCRNCCAAAVCSDSLVFEWCNTTCAGPAAGAADTRGRGVRVGVERHLVPVLAGVGVGAGAGAGGEHFEWW